MRKFSHLFSILTRLISFKMCLLTLSSRNIYNNRSRNESTFLVGTFLLALFGYGRWSGPTTFLWNFTSPRGLRRPFKLNTHWISTFWEELRHRFVYSCHFFLQMELNGKNRWQKIIFQKCSRSKATPRHQSTKSQNQMANMFQHFTLTMKLKNYITMMMTTQQQLWS